MISTIKIHYSVMLTLSIISHSSNRFHPHSHLPAPIQLLVHLLNLPGHEQKATIERTSFGTGRKAIDPVYILHKYF